MGESNNNGGGIAGLNLPMNFSSATPNNMSMGGTYLGYLMIDEKKGKLYYMEGFVYFPNEIHRDALREIQAVLLKTNVSWTAPKGS